MADMQTFQTPRVNGRLLSQFVDQAVCLVGRVKSQDPAANEEGGTAVLETTDGYEVVVQTQPGNRWNSQFVELIGHVHDQKSIQEFKSTEFGDAFDANTYNKMIELTAGKYSYLFYGAAE